MIRFATAAIRAFLLILGFILASCFIGRGADRRMRRVVSAQQHYMQRRIRNRW